jgi:hypothetical protein
MRARLFFVATAVALVSVPSAARAQEDFRAADLDRPLRVEDARPTEFRAWELELGSRGSFEEGVSGLHGVLELKAGLIRNAQMGLEVESGLRSLGSGAGTDTGLEAVTAHLLYGVARETPSLPALAVRVEGSTPGTGAVGHEDAQLGVKAIFTRSLGRLRLHANGGYTVASDADAADYWRVGLATDYPIGLFSRAVLADVYAEIPTSQGRSRVWVDVGTRLQMTNRSVLDVGVATRLDQWGEDNANVELVIGFSRVFGLFGGAPPYPDPSIR